MNHTTIKMITGRLSLRSPQRESLEALARALATNDHAMLNPKRDVPLLLQALQADFPTLKDFERDFPSLCFALATGVGKTRLMGAFISYLYLAHGIKNFFVLAPNLTIYDKLIGDFSPDNPKYVFKGMAEFATYPPRIITGDNYEEQGRYYSGVLSPITINIFNIAKINSEVRGGKAPRIKRLSEYLGDSYFNYLSKLEDLVLLMDESHRYRASAGVRALNELNPLFGLELTATPFVETAKGAIPFQNVIVDYPLARAMDDGFVKEPAVATQRNFNAENYSKEEIERIKLQDGIRLHEQTKVELLTYAHENDLPVVKPFMLVIARDTTHAKQLRELMEADSFFSGNYRGKIIQVDSSKSGADEEEMIRRLLSVESVNEPTEIVVHVNMLKEGWDVTNLYTIVPLRAANARTLIEQSIGRGLRLPYGKRTKVEAVDRLSIVAHDRFQEIIDEANKADNPLRLKQLILERDDDDPSTESVSVVSNLDAAITGKQTTGSKGTEYTPTHHKTADKPVFNGVAEQEVAKVTYKVIQELQRQPDTAPTVEALQQADVQQKIVDAVNERLTGEQRGLFAEAEQTNLADVVSKTTELVIQQTINIPRIYLAPKAQVKSGYHPFTLDVSSLSLQPTERDVVVQSLQTNLQVDTLKAQVGIMESRPENYIIHALVDYDDICYDEHADLIYDLAGQVVTHLQSYLSADEVHNVLDSNRQLLAKNLYIQMQKHYWEDSSEYEVEVKQGFTSLKECAYTAAAGQVVQSYRNTVTETGKIKQLLFGNFQRCLYPLQKFDSDTERQFAVLLERDAQKWFKPVKGQFKLFYKDGVEHPEYVPDFVAELEDVILMVETKASKDMDNELVKIKAAAATAWCKNASDYLLHNGGKAWKYLLIPYTEVKEANMLKSYVQQFVEA
ncbi:MAG: type III restriction endonuclease subunit R [Thiothrix lacustris]|uniref:Type III restriction endonuclease subunit R n=1 Tax=Thiothrix lacustris TaxID=525917 RepID=A0A1Y1QID1_9GAMM|nr:MAG: type III restriction endonuclease subunit R [Thiothrix lacustris]